MEASTAVDGLMSHLTTQTIASIEGYGQGFNDAWFARTILENGLLGLLKYATSDRLVESMHALLYAFAHPGTREGFCQLCLGVFGRNAIIFIEDTPAVVSIAIQVSQSDFSFAFAEGDYTFAQSFVFAGDSLAQVASDPRAFLQEFLPAGVILQALDISTQRSVVHV